ncbi:MAG: hypothetical protein M3N37_01175 [Actinomycetota bacterium]|nr:hypothetical protein [Actinomycetota bacterium]
MGELVGETLHSPGVAVDAEDVEAQVDQLLGNAAAEPAQADDENLLTGCGSVLPLGAPSKRSVNQ